MNIFVLSIYDVSPENAYIMDAKKNILMEGIFSKMIYVDPYFSMNGIYIHLPIEIQSIENNINTSKLTVPLLFSANRSMAPMPPPPLTNKKTITFSVIKHAYLLQQIEMLEKKILDRYIPLDANLPKIYTIIQTLKFGYFRIYRESVSSKSVVTDTPSIFILKISGIWENSKGYGLSYKIMEVPI
jgi:hypothetical protein